MFRFKQFTIQDDRCAMKVGTDGTLLGAWAYAEFTQKGQSPLCKILDIGTGSGLVALMLAQRFLDAQILGIDIEPEAVEQARENFAASPWGERLNAQTIRLQELADKPDMQGRFALVASNPPYFADSLKNPDAGRKTARHTDTLSFEELMVGAAKLLSDEGVLALVLPAEAEQEIVRLAQENGLTPCRLTRVYTRAGKPCKRILVSFRKTTKWGLSLNGSFLQVDGLCLMGADGTPRSLEYQELTKEFYL